MNTMMNEKNEQGEVFSYINKKKVLGGCGHELYRIKSTIYMTYPEPLFYECRECRKFFRLNDDRTTLVELED